MKKGLAVALAAATVLTFAPVSAFAGTVRTTTGNVGTKTNQTFDITMNEGANTWAYSDTHGTSATAKALTDENKAVVVLTPSDPTGSVTYTVPITQTDSTKLSDGVWFTNLTATPDSTAKDLKLTAAKNGKTLTIEANVGYLRTLAQPQVVTIAKTAAAGTIDQSLTGLADDLALKVVLVPHPVTMNQLKVTLSKSNDSALQRYKTNEGDVYDYYEARPDYDNVATNKDVPVTTSNDIALDGQRITGVTLNLADAAKKDITFKAESKAELKYDSDNTAIATIDKDGIHAKGVGTTNVYITTKQSMTAYGEVTVTIPVEVINKPTATLTAPTDLTVKGFDEVNAVTIGATGTNIQKYSIKYTFVHWDSSTQDYIAFNKTTPDDPSDYNPYKLSESADKVWVESYTGKKQDGYDWNAYLKVTATGADGYLDPAPKYIKLHFNNDNPFDIDTTSQKLHTGESVQITTKITSAVTGAAFAYKSWNPAVATVSDKGVITAVGEGSTTVDVTYAGYKQSVTVRVLNYENGNGSVSTPAKVTGVKVANVKGGKVKVTWDAASNSNVKYYVKKTVSGKSAGKSVGSNGTTLTVKKGATVKVKVKAYVYDNSGKKLVGAYSTTVTKKTDNK